MRDDYKNSLMGDRHELYPYWSYIISSYNAFDLSAIDFIHTLNYYTTLYTQQA